MSTEPSTDQSAGLLPSAEAGTLLQAVVDGAEDLIFAKDVAGRFILINRALAVSAPDLLGRTVEDHYDPDLAVGYREVDLVVMETGATHRTEEVIPIAGRRRVFQTIKAPWSVNGAVRGVIGISRDITERHEAEARTRANEERYRLAARATNDAIWDWDLVTDEITWSEAIERLAGEQPGRTGTWWKSRIDLADRERVLDSIDRFAREGGDTWQCEYGFRHNDGSYRAVFDRGFLVRDELGKPIRMIGAMSDLSERMKAQKRVLQLQSELIHVSRVSAMGTIASALAHEINQPLASVSNYVMGARRLLATQSEASLEEARAAMELAAAEVARAGDIVRRIRRMVAHGEIQLQRVAVPQLIEDALALALPNPALAGVEVRLGHRRGMVQGDPVQLQQVLVNLIRNAVESMEARSRRVLSLSTRREGDQLHLEIQDTGCGIPEERRETIFTAFGSGKPGGLGVGLTICRTIVEAHAGTISVASTSELGTCISVTLPAAASPSTRSEPVRART